MLAGPGRVCLSEEAQDNPALWAPEKSLYHVMVIAIQQNLVQHRDTEWGKVFRKAQNLDMVNVVRWVPGYLGFGFC